MPANPAPAEMGGTIDAAGTTSIIGYRLRRAQLKVYQGFLADFDELSQRPADSSMQVRTGS